MPLISVTQVQLWPWVVSVDLNLTPKGFSPGPLTGFPPSSKSTPSQLHLAGFALLRDHTWIVWRQPWAPSHAFGPIPLSQLILKSPCRERSTTCKRTFTFTTLFSWNAVTPGDSHYQTSPRWQVEGIKTTWLEPMPQFVRCGAFGNSNIQFS